jgi:hypothetical protein
MVGWFLGESVCLVAFGGERDWLQGAEWLFIVLLAVVSLPNKSKEPLIEGPNIGGPNT